MAENEKEKVVFQDYEREPVPEEKRYKWYSQAMVWIGACFCLPCLSVGTTLASSMPFGKFVASCIIGAAILWCIATLFGVLGANTNLASAFCSRFALGVGGSKIFGLMIAISLFGWFGFQCVWFGSSVVTTFDLLSINVGSVQLWTIIGGLLMMITAVVGFKGIKFLSDFGIPLLFVLIVVGMIVTLKSLPAGTISANAKAVVQTLPLPAGITMVVGGWSTATCMLPDISRYAASKKDSVIGSTIGFLISYPIILMIGGFFYYAYQTSDVVAVFITYCNLGVIAAIVLVISTWTTNDNNLYSSVLGITNAMPEAMLKKVPRQTITIIVGVISTLLGVFGIINYFLGFLSLLGAIYPPVAVAILADYYLYNKDQYEFENIDKAPAFRANTCIASAIGMLVGILATYTSVLSGLTAILPPAVIAMIAVLIALVIINAVSKTKGKYEFK